MNDEAKAELESRVVAYLDGLEKELSGAKEFVKDEAPRVASEFLAWEFWSNFVFAVIAAVACLFLVAGVIWSFREYLKEHDDTVFGLLVF